MRHGCMLQRICRELGGTTYLQRAYGWAIRRTDGLGGALRQVGTSPSPQSITRVAAWALMPPHTAAGTSI